MRTYERYVTIIKVTDMKSLDLAAGVEPTDWQTDYDQTGCYKCGAEELLADVDGDLLCKTCAEGK